MATNPFTSSPLSSSAGYERDELEEFRSSTTAADDHEYQRVTSHHSVISLQHHNQAITSSPTTISSPAFPTQIPNLQIDRDDAGLLLPSSASSMDDDLYLMAEKMMHLPPSSAVAHEAGHGRLARWCPPLRPLGRLLRWLNPRIRHTNPSGGSLAGYWYISAEQHVLEFLLFNLTFAGLLVYFGINLVAHAPEKTPAEPTGTIIMYVLAGLLSLSFLYTIFYKWMTKSLIFLLQPCHVITTVELLVLFAPHGSFIDMTIVFNLMLYWVWNPLIAILQPDLRDYKHFRDLFNYFFQHALIILIPFYLLFTRQYDLYHWSWENLVVSFNLQVLYHFFVLEVVNLFACTNLNYMMAPPPGPLEWFGPWYRVVMTCLSFGLTVGQRLLLVDGGRWLLGDILYDHVFHYFP